MLQEMLDKQQILHNRLAEERHLSYSPEEWVQKYALAMLDEITELLNEVNYKWWKNPKPIDQDAVKEEMVDVFHFFLSMCLQVGMDAGELYARYCEKNAENHARQDGTSKKDGYQISEFYAAQEKEA